MSQHRMISADIGQCRACTVASFDTEKKQKINLPLLYHQGCNLWINTPALLTCSHLYRLHIIKVISVTVTHLMTKVPFQLPEQKRLNEMVQSVIS